MKNTAVEKVTAILSTNACPELKDAAQKWLDATAALIAELKEDVIPIDGEIAFFGTDFAKEKFGADKAAELKAHAEASKAAGAVYCDCAGCVAGLEVLKEFGEA